MHGQVGDVIVMLSVACAVCTGLLESVTCTLKLIVPIPVGVPEITPPVESANPPGKFDPDTSVQLYGALPPPATNAWLYATPCAPAGIGDGVATVSGAPAAVLLKTTSTQ